MVRSLRSDHLKKKKRSVRLEGGFETGHERPRLFRRFFFFDGGGSGIASLHRLIGGMNGDWFEEN
jgi:hypothetical protein